MIYSKKGGQDVFFIVIMVFIIALLLPVFNIVMDSLNDVLQDVDMKEVDDTKSKEQSEQLTSGFTSTSDFIFASIYFAFFLGAVILSYFLNTHPIFIIGGIIILILLVWLSMSFSNVWMDVTSEGVMSEEVNKNFPMTSFIMNWFAELNIGLIVIVLLVLYQKNTGY